jgi:hypothetical protein
MKTIKFFLRLNLPLLASYLAAVLLIVNIIPGSSSSLLSKKDTPLKESYLSSSSEGTLKLESIAALPLEAKSPSILEVANSIKNDEKFVNNRSRNAQNRYGEWMESNRKVKINSPRHYALLQFEKYEWNIDPQWGCLDRLWWHESNWNYKAGDSSGRGAYGIPQSAPGNKMKEAGQDWKNNPETQIDWGLDYINNRYGTPCKAFKFWKQQAEYGDMGYGWY